MEYKLSGRRVDWHSHLKVLLLGLLGILFVTADTKPLMASEAWPWTHQPSVNGTKDSKPWSAVVGKKVAVEGIAWGSYGKGIGEYVIINNSEKVYIRNANFLNIKAHGKLVRVVGVLERFSVKKAKPSSESLHYQFTQGPPPGFVAYFIRPEKLEIIDRVEWPWMKEVGKFAKRTRKSNSAMQTISLRNDQPAMKAELLKHIPIGTHVIDAERILKASGLNCGYGPPADNDPPILACFIHKSKELPVSQRWIIYFEYVDGKVSSVNVGRKNNGSG